MKHFSDLEQEDMGFAAKLYEMAVIDRGQNYINEGAMAFIGKPCTCLSGEMRTDANGVELGPSYETVLNCPRHSIAESTYLSHFAQEGDSSTTAYYYGWPGEPERWWPKSIDITSSESVFEGYVKAIHGLKDIEGWLNSIIDWLPIDPPKFGVDVLLSWNEPGEPGGQNPGPTFFIRKDGKWTELDESGLSEDENEELIEAFFDATETG